MPSGLLVLRSNIESEVLWACSSDGRASGLHPEGHWFDPSHVHYGVLRVGLINYHTEKGCRPASWMKRPPGFDSLILHFLCVYGRVARRVASNHLTLVRSQLDALETDGISVPGRIARLRGNGEGAKPPLATATA